MIGPQKHPYSIEQDQVLDERIQVRGPLLGCATLHAAISEAIADGVGLDEVKVLWCGTGAGASSALTTAEPQIYPVFTVIWVDYGPEGTSSSGETDQAGGTGTPSGPPVEDAEEDPPTG